MTTTTVIITMLVLIIIVLIWIVVNLLSKVEAYEDVRSALEVDYLDIRNFLVEISSRLSADYKRIKEVDRKGSFESDDEVGFIFQSILRTVEDSYSYISKVEIVEEGDGEKEEGKQETVFYK